MHFTSMQPDLWVRLALNWGRLRFGLRFYSPGMLLEHLHGQAILSRKRQLWSTAG